jgi:uncharacterized protein (TIGR02145 family)
MKHNYTLRLFVITVASFFLLMTTHKSAFSQCTNCQSNFPSGWFSTTSSAWTNVSSCVYGGEFSYYTLSTSYIYQWRTAGTAWDTQLTLWPSGTCGGSSLAFNTNHNPPGGTQSLISYLPGQTSVRVLMSQNWCANNASCGTLSWRAININPTIAANWSYVCSGAAVTLSRDLPNDGDYAYTRWGTSAGGTQLSANAHSVTVYPTANTTYYMYHTALPGYQNTNNASVTINVTAQPSAPTTATKSPDVASVCSGQTLTLSGAAAGGNAGINCSIGYRYSSDNGANWTETGTSIPSFAAVTSANNYIQARRYNCQTGCTATGWGTVASWAVAAQATATVSASTTICTGGSTTLSCAVTGGTGSYGYQWQRRLPGGAWGNVGSNSSSYGTGALSTTYEFQCIVTVGGNNCTNPTSNTVTVTVVAQPSVSIGVSGGQPSTVCNGAGTQLTVTGGNPGTGTITYQWQRRPPSGAWANTGSNSTLLNTGGLTTDGTWTFRCMKYANGTGCNWAYSNEVSISVVAQPGAPTSATKSPDVASVCSGHTLTLSGAASGGNPGIGCSIEYAYSTDNGSNWTSTGTSVPSFTSVQSTSNQIRARRYNCQSGCNASGWNTLATWSVVAAPSSPTTATKSPNVASVCSGTTLTLSGAASGGNAGVGCSIEYRYSSDNGTNWVTTSTSIPSFAAATSTSNIIQARRANCQTGCTSPTAWTSVASWSVVAQPAAPTTATKNPNVTNVCTGTTLTLSVAASGGNAGISCTIEYRYSTDGGSNWVTTGTSIPSFAAAQTNNIIQARRASCQSGCTTTGWGQVASWTGVAQPGAPTSATKSPNVASVCSGTTLSLSGAASGGNTGVGCSIEYAYSTDNGSNWVSTGTSIPSFAAVLTTTNQIRARRYSCQSGCTESGWAVLASWSIVAAPDAPTTATKSPNVPTVCAGTTLTLSGAASGGNGGVGCSIEYAYSADNGVNWTSTGTSIPSFAAVTSVSNQIRARRYNCQAGCSTSAWNTLATWEVVPQPTAPNTSTKNPNVASVCSGTTLTLTYNGGFLDFSTWQAGQTGSVGQFSLNGDVNENHRVIAADPWGNNAVVWETRASGNGEADGGWNSSFFSIDNTKLYRFAVWVRRTSASAGGTFYLGTNGSPAAVKRVDNSADQGNPYWDCPATSTLAQNQWYLVVGHVFPHNYAGTTGHPESGYYTVAGGTTKIKNCNGCNVGADVKTAPTTTQLRHRTYHYYCGDNTTRLQFAYPMIHLVDGSEPKINDLVKGIAGFGGSSGVGCSMEYRFSTNNGSTWSTGSTSIPSFAAVTGTNLVQARRVSCQTGCTESGWGQIASWSVVAGPAAPTTATKSPNVASVCSGTTLTLSGAASGGNAGVGCSIEYAYSTDNGSNWVGTGTSIPSFAAVTSTTNRIRARRYNCQAGCADSPWGDVASWGVVNQPSSPTTATKSPNVPSVCAGTTLTLSGAASGGNAGVNCSIEYQYSTDGSNWTNTGTSVPSFAAGAAGNTNTIQTRRSGCLAGCNTTAWNTVATWSSVAQPDAPTTATKNPNVASVCSGTTLTLSAAASGGNVGVGCSIEYAYSTDNGSNWTSTGTSIPSFAAVTSTSNQIRARRYNCQGGCNASAWNTLASWAVSAQPSTPTATKSPNVASVCSGQTLTLTSPSGSGGTGTCNFEYQHSTNNGSTWSAWSTTVSSFAAVTGTNMIRIRRVCNGTGCNASGYTEYSWTVAAQPAAPTATKSPNVASVCAGQTLTLTSPSGSGGTGTCNFEYRHSTNNGGTWTGWSTTVSSFAAVTGTNLIEIRRNCNGSNCTPSSATQYAWTVVAQTAAPTATKAPNLASVCSGTTLSLTGVTDNGGGTGTCNIEYRHSTDNGSTWTSWSTTASSFAAVTGTNIIQIRKNCNGTGCSVSSTSAYSWSVVAQTSSPTTATKSPDAASVCSGATLTLTGHASGGNAGVGCSIEYQYSTDGGTSYTNTGTSIPSFAAATGTNIIQVRRSGCTGGSGCNTTAWNTVATWTGVAQPAAPTATKSPNVAAVCSGQTLTLSGVTDNGGGTGSCNIEYRHSTNNGSTWTAWSTSASSFAAVTGTNLIEIRKNCSGSGCNVSTSSQYSWTVAAQPSIPTATKSPNVASVCAGQTLTLTSPTSTGGTGTCNFEYQHSTNNGGTWTGWSTTVSSFAAVVGTNLIRIRRVCSGTGCNTTAHTEYSWTVTAQPAAPTATKSPNVASVCVGQTITLIGVTDNGGGIGTCNIEYRHSTNNGGTWTLWSTTASSFAAVTGTNLIEIRKNCNGTGCNVSSSSQYSWTVAAQPTAPTATKSPNVASVCAGQTLTLTSPSGSGGTGTCNFEYRHSTNNGGTWTGWSTTVSSFAAVTGTNLIEIRRNCNGSNCTPSSATQYAWTVVAQTAAPTATKAPNLASVCSGTTLSLTGVTDNGGGTGTCNIEYRHSTDNGSTWTSWSTTASSFAAVTGTNIIQIRKNCNGTGCSVSSTSAYSWSVVAQTSSPTTATKSPDAASVCSGATLTLTGHASGGNAGVGCSIEYQYSTDGGTSYTNTGTSIPSFAAATGTNIIQVRRSGCTGGSGCNTTAWNTVATWTGVAQPAAPTATKSPNVAAVCSGQTLTLSGVTDNGGGTGSCNIEYRHSTNNGSTWTAWSTSASSFAAVTGTNLIEIRKNCSGSGCNVSISSQYSWAVVDQPSTPTATKSPNVATVCAGQTLTLTNPSSSGGTGTCNFEYQYNTGSGWSSWSTTVPSFAAITGTNQIRIRRTCTGTGCSTSAYSEYSWTVAAQPAAPTATKSPNVATVCAGQTLTLTGVTDNGGGTGTCNIEYRHSTNNGSTWTSWSTTSSSFAAVTGTNLIQIRKNCNGTGCNVSATSEYSWAVVDQPSIPTATKSPNVATVCAGQTLTLTSPSSTGGTGTCNFEYQHSTDNGSSWTSWSTTVSSFAAVVGTNRIRIRRVCSGTGCNTTAHTEYSWAVTAQPAAPTATKSPNVATVCSGQTLTLSGVTDNGGGAGTCNIEYRHSTNGGSTWTSWATSASSFAAVTGTNLIQIRKNCSATGCNVSSTSEYSWTVVAQPSIPTATKSPNVASVCSGQTLTLINPSSSGGTGTCNYEYQHSTDNGGSWTGWSTTVSSFAAVTGTNLIRIRRVCSGTGCNTTAYSEYSWTVAAQPAAPTATKSPNVATVCAGQTLTLSGVTDNGGGTGTCNIEYRHSTNNGSTWTSWSTTSSSFAAVTGTNLIQIRKNCNGTGCNVSATSEYSWAVVDQPSIPTATKSPNVATVCAGQTLTLTSPSSTGGTGTCNFEYQHSTDNGSSWTSWSTTVSSFAAVVGTNRIRIRRVCNGTGCNTTAHTEYSWAVTAQPAAPTATKSPNVATVCAGQTLTLSGVTDNGGGTGTCNIEYRHSTNNGSTWTSWSTTASSFAAVTGTNLIEIRKNCSGSGCNVSTSSQYSWIVVAQPSTPTATKSPNVASVCAGQTLTLTSPSSTGGTGTCNFEYQHSSDNGSSWTSWSTTVSSFAAVAGTNHIRIRRVCSGTGCNTTAHTEYSWTVTAQPAAPTATKSPNVATVCAGQTLTLSGVTDNGGGTGTCNIEYRHSTNNGGTWTSWSTTASSFAAVTGTNLIEIRKNCNGTGCNVSSTSQYSWTVVAQPSAPTASKSPDVTTVCAGQTLTLTNPSSSGGTGTCNYEYQHSTNNGGAWTSWSTTVSSFAAVAGTNLIRIRRVCSGTGCNTTAHTEYSWTVVPQPAISVHPIGVTICYGETHSMGVTASGGTPSLNYQWQSSPDNATWSIIGGATASTYTTTTLTTSTYYRVIVGATGTGCSSTNSNSAHVIVHADLTSGAVAYDQTICYNTAPAAFEETVPSSGGTGVYTYQWQQQPGCSGAWANIGSTNATTYQAPVLTQTTCYKRLVTSGSCGTVETGVVTVTVNAVLNPGSVDASQTIEYGANAQTLSTNASASGGVGGYSYLWQRDIGCSGSWLNISGATSTTYSPGPLYETTCYRRSVTNTCGTDYTNSVQITVRAPLTPGAIQADQTICYNAAPAQFTNVALPTGGNGTYSYNWQSSTDNLNWSSIGGATASTYTATSLTADTYFRRCVTSDGQGPVCTGVEYNIIWTDLENTAVTKDADSITPAHTGLIADFSTWTHTNCVQRDASGNNYFSMTVNTASVITPTLTLEANVQKELYFQARTYGGVTGNSNEITVSISLNDGTSWTVLGTRTPVSTSLLNMQGFDISGYAGNQVKFKFETLSAVSSRGVGIDNIAIRNINSFNLHKNAGTNSVFNAGAASIQKVWNGGYAYTVADEVTRRRYFGLSTANSGANESSINYAFRLWSDGTLRVYENGTAKGIAGTYTTGDTLKITVENSVVKYYKNSTLFYTSLVAPTLPLLVDVSLYTTTTSTLKSNKILSQQPLLVTVNDELSGGQIGATQTICYNEAPPVFTDVTSPAGGDASYTYQWQQQPGCSGGWSDIGGADAPTYQAPTLTQNTCYRRKVESCGDTKYSNTITITLHPQISAYNIEGTGAQCDPSQTLYLVDSDVGITYELIYGGSTVATVAGDGDSISFGYQTGGGLYSAIGYNTVTGCTIAMVNTYNISTLPLPGAAGSISGTATVCQGQAGVTYSVDSIDHAVNYIWSLPSGATITAGDSTKSITVTFTDSAQSGNITVYGTNDCGDGVISANYAVTVNLLPFITAQPNDVGICENTNTSFSVAAGGQATLQYQWQVHDGNSWSNITAAGSNPTYSNWTTATLGLTSVQYTNNGFMYRCVVSSTTCNTSSAVSDEATLTVHEAPEVTVQPGNQSVCEYTNTSFSITASGYGAASFAYQWQVSTDNGSNWSNITAAGAEPEYSGYDTDELLLTDVVLTNDGYMYRCIVSGVCAPDATSNAGTLSVNPAPEVIDSPQHATICVGTNTTFSVNASGHGILTYQWQVSTDGGSIYNNITAAGSNPTYANWTTATLGVNAVAIGNNNYRYRVLVSGDCQPPYLSDNAILTVQPAPAVTDNPDNVNVCEGLSANFDVTATGPGLTYRWQVSTDGGSNWSNIINGAPYFNATTTELLINPVSLTMNGNLYKAHIMGDCNPSTNSSQALLTVYAAPTANTHPSDSEICENANTSFSVTASGQGTLGYQWQLSTDGGSNWNNLSNGGVYSNVTSSTMNITAAPASMNAYRYRTEVSGDCNPPTLSNGALLTVLTAPVITANPLSDDACELTSMDFSVTATGSGLNYQWQVSTDGGSNWSNLSNTSPYGNVNTATMTINPLDLSMDDNQYRVYITGSCTPAVTSSAAVLTVNAAPVIVSHPNDSTICENNSATFSVTATGYGAIEYQWQASSNGGSTWNNILNLPPYSGIDQATMTVSNALDTMDAFQFRCVAFANCFPVAISDPATLYVQNAPVVTTHPTTHSACENASTTFSVTASGVGLSYQWQVSTNNGSTWINLSNTGSYTDVTAATMGINPVLLSMNDYQYRAIVIGTCAPTDESNAATLTVNPAPTVSVQPIDSEICENTNTSFSVTASGHGALSYQWQLSADGGSTWNNLSNGGVYSNVTAATVNITTAVLSMNGYRYRCEIDGDCNPASISNSALLTILAAPVVTVNPFSHDACENDQTSFTVAATGAGLTYQWQLSTDNGVSWSNLSNAGSYSDVTTTTLTINPIELAMNAYQFKAHITGTCTPAANSNAATLTVNPAPVITQHPSDSTICENNNATFSVQASGHGIQSSVVLGTQLWMANNLSTTTYNDGSAIGTDFSGTSGAYAWYNNDSATYSATYGALYNWYAIDDARGICPTGWHVATDTEWQTLEVFLGISPVDVGNLGFRGSTNEGSKLSGSFSLWDNGNLRNNAAFDESGFNGVPAGRRAAGASGLFSNINSASLYWTSSQYDASNGLSRSITYGQTGIERFYYQKGRAQSVRCVGNNSLSGGAAPYQWQVSTNNGASWSNLSDGGMYANVNTPELSVIGATAGMDGYLYRCVVYGICSPADTSSGALLTVLTPPVITAQPASQNACENGSVDFFITATGAGLTYQWQIDDGSGWSNLSNNTTYSGVTTNNLEINPVTMVMDNDQFRVIVYGTCTPEDTSNVVTLTVDAAPVVTNDPDDDTICPLGSTDLEIQATGFGTITYQWQYYNGSAWENVSNGTPLGAVYTGAATNSMNVSGISVPGVYTYVCFVSGTCNPPTYSASADVTVLEYTEIIGQPVNDTVCQDLMATFEVSAQGTGLTYQWQYNNGGTWEDIPAGVPYMGVNTSELVVSPASLSLDGQEYRVVIEGTCTPFADTSDVVKLVVNPAPVVDVQPINDTICPLSIGYLGVEASGTGTLTYQWQYNNSGVWENVTNGTPSGASYTNATTDTITINGISVVDAHEYRCEVSGDCNPPTISDTVLLYVMDYTSIATQPLNDTVCEGLIASFEVIALGTNLTYQWQLNNAGTWENINSLPSYTGETSSQLTVNPASITLDGQLYRVVVYGLCTPFEAISNAVELSVKTSSCS